MAIQHRNAATHSERLASLEKGGEKKKKKEHVSREIKSPCNVGEGTSIEYNTKSINNTVQNQVDSTVQDGGGIKNSERPWSVLTKSKKDVVGFNTSWRS